ncbi:MAG: hypothetical protein SPH02_06520, partial [Campylobacter sp.]|nr:hypothetical protein [Campylobacter sp.]
QQHLSARIALDLGILEFLKLEFPSLVPSPDLTLGSHHKEFRIPYRDPRVKPEDDIVGNSRIPKSRIPCFLSLF